MPDCSSGISITYYKTFYHSVTAFVIDFIGITADRAVDYLGIFMVKVRCRFKIDFKRLEAKVTSYLKKKVVNFKKFFHEDYVCYF